MRLYAARQLAMMAMSTVLRHSGAFVVPLRAIVKPKSGNAFIRCCMTANAASPPVNSRPLVLDAETAEVKVESLWGMVDARASPSLESSEMQSPEEVVDKLRTSLKLSVFDSPEEGDNFFEEEVRASALNRYHYDEAVDMDDSSDDKEYYI